MEGEAQKDEASVCAEGDRQGESDWEEERAVDPQRKGDSLAFAGREVQLHREYALRLSGSIKPLPPHRLPRRGRPAVLHKPGRGVQRGANQ